MMREPQVTSLTLQGREKKREEGKGQMAVTDISVGDSKKETEEDDKNNNIMSALPHRSHDAAHLHKGTQSDVFCFFSLRLICITHCFSFFLSSVESSFCETA
jgi:hypothetical protein